MASTVQFVAVILLHLCLASSSLHFDPVEVSELSEQEHEYLRFADVRRHCESVLSSAIGLPYDPNRPDRLKHQVSFEKGDWRQDVGKAPLVPFDVGDAPNKGTFRLPHHLSLASFKVTHVDGDEEHRAMAAVNVSGVLILTVTRKSVVEDLGDYIFPLSPEFNLSADSIRLKIIFEGVYTERAKGNGNIAQQTLCMVGSALLPRRSMDAVDPWDWTKNSGRSSFQPPVTDDNILLVLQYPKKLTLTTRAVHGKMESTSSPSDVTYFDTVKLMSALISRGPYHFCPEELAAGVGDGLASSDADNGVFRRARDVYKGSYPCLVLSRYGHRGQAISALPGWHCNTTAGASCHNIGPFEMDQAADADRSAGVRIIMQDLRCQEQPEYGTTIVSAVFRALSPWEDWGTAMSRTGLSGKTLLAEGVWNATTGQVCMVACRRKGCDLRMCLFFPTTLSITRMDSMLGQINGLDDGGGVAHQPLLSFRQHIGTPRLWGDYPKDGKPLVQYKYNYTKVKQAVELRKRTGSSFDLRKIVSQFLPLSYPKRDDADDDMRSLPTLANWLTLCFLTVPGLFRNELLEQPVLYLEVVSLQQLVDRYTPPRHRGGKEHRSEEHPLLNVSAKLLLFEDQDHQISVISLEGVYDQNDGRMHLIGCRDVRLPRENSSASRNDLQLEEGMDCSIEVKVEYPPLTMHLYVMSTAKVQIASTRMAADPLHFHALRLRALPTHYPYEQSSEFYRGVTNGVICIILMSATLAAVLSQLRYLKLHTDVAPYISLVMLSVQALGYGMPLVTGVEAILARVNLRLSGDGLPPVYSSRTTSYYTFGMGRLCETIGQAVKVLSLCALVLTLRHGQKVWRSRERMVARSPLDPARVPGDGRVFVYSCGVHLVIFVLIVALNSERVTVEQQVALTQDLFLLPQVIGNAVWRVNCAPLKGSFYTGVTAVRLLPHMYDYLRPTAAFVGGGDFVDAASRGQFFAKAGDVVIPLAAVALVLVVHAQQRWNYAIISRMGKAERKKLEHIF